MKSMIIFIYIISLALVTHQTPIPGCLSSNCTPCSKEEKQCDDQCYNPEKYACLPSDTNKDKTQFRLSSIEQTFNSTTTIVNDRKTNNSPMCRTNDHKECVCGKNILYDPRKYECHYDELVCKESNEDCPDTGNEIRKIDRRKMGTKAAVEFGSKAGDELIKIGSNKLQQFLNNINLVAEDRADFTKKAVAHFKAVTNGRKNILVIDNKWPNMVDVGNAYLKIHIEVPKPVSGTNGFDIYIFDRGVVTKHGDGGFQNWRYYGNAKKIDGDSQNIRFNKIG